MHTTTPPAVDASVHMAMLRHIQGQLQSGQRRVSWNVQQAITEQDRQMRIRMLRLGVYASIPCTAVALLFIHDTLPSQLFYILLALVLVVHAAMVFGLLPVAVRRVAQLTHQQVQVYIDRQRQRVVTVDSNTQRSRTYAFRTTLTTPTTSAGPSGLHLLGGAPQQPTAEHMQIYRTVCNHLQQVTGLVFV